MPPPIPPHTRLQRLLHSQNAKTGTLKRPFYILYSKRELTKTQFKDQDLILILVNLTGIIGGVFLLTVLQPPTDFYFLLPASALAGVAVANLVLLLLIQLGKELNQKTE